MAGVSWQWFFLSKMIWFGKGCCVVLVVDSNFNTVTWKRSCCFWGLKCSLSNQLLKFKCSLKSSFMMVFKFKIQVLKSFDLCSHTNLLLNVSSFKFLWIFIIFNKNTGFHKCFKKGFVWWRQNPDPRILGLSQLVSEQQVICIWN